MKISIIIPTYNRLSQLKRTLAMLEVQNYPHDDFEVVIVSDGSTDGTDEFLGNYSSSLTLKLIRQNNSGPAAARNHGVNLAEGQYILFLDDDVVPTSELINEHLNYHERFGKRIVVIGTMLTPSDYQMSPWVSWEQQILEEQYRDMLLGKYQPTARQFYTGNASLERILFIQNRGFNTTFRRAEDVEFAFRLEKAGITFKFNPGAIGYHYARRSLESWMETPYLYGKNNVIFAKDLGNDWLVPITFAEFSERNALTQLLVKLCVGRDTIKNPLVDLLLSISESSYKIGLRSLSHIVLSGIYNLQFYQGFSEELGGREYFMHLIRQAH